MKRLRHIANAMAMIFSFYLKLDELLMVDSPIDHDTFVISSTLISQIVLDNDTFKCTECVVDRTLCVI